MEGEVRLVHGGVSMARHSADLRIHQQGRHVGCGQATDRRDGGSG